MRPRRDKQQQAAHRARKAKGRLKHAAEVRVGEINKNWFARARPRFPGER